MEYTPQTDWSFFYLPRYINTRSSFPNFNSTFIQLPPNGCQAEPSLPGPAPTTATFRTDHDEPSKRPSRLRPQPVGVELQAAGSGRIRQLLGGESLCGRLHRGRLGLHLASEVLHLHVLQERVPVSPGPGWPHERPPS